MIYLDILRIASSYLIIIYHFQNQMYFGRFASVVRQKFDGFTLGVDLFFFISGFVISSVYSHRITSLSGYGSFLGKRAARLIPLHWVTLVIFIIFGALHILGYMPSNHPQIYDFRCIIPNFLLLQAFGLCPSLTFNYVSWSISAEIGLYIVFPIFAVVAVRKILALLLVVITVALLMIASREGTSWLDWSFDLGILRALPTFFLGVISFNYRNKLARVPRAASLLAFASVAFIGGCLLEWPKIMLLPLIYCIALLAISASEQPASHNARRFAPLGQLTYSLYMLHPVIQTVLLTGIGSTLLKLNGLAMNLFVIISMVIMLPLAWISLVMFERPARRWLTSLIGLQLPPVEAAISALEPRR